MLNTDINEPVDFGASYIVEEDFDNFTPSELEDMRGEYVKRNWEFDQ